MSSKSIKLECTASGVELFTTGKMYRGTLKEDGSVFVRGNDGKRVFIGSMLNNEFNEIDATFILLKTKTILCTDLGHSNPEKKDFKVGKRYQVNMGRAFGSHAGVVFDEQGYPWNLYRDDVGFEVASGFATFESAYR